MKAKLIPFLLLLLALILPLAGCQAPADNTDPVQPLDPLPVIDDPINTAETIADSLFVGNYTNSYSTLFASKAADAYSPFDTIPTLHCKADGTFSLTVIHDMTTGETRTVTGVFTIAGDVATCTADDGNAVFTLTLVNQNELRYGGDQIDCVVPGDVFARDSE